MKTRHAMVLSILLTLRGVVSLSASEIELHHGVDTYLLTVELQETVGQVKQRVSGVLDVPAAALRVSSGGQRLRDSSPIDQWLGAPISLSVAGGSVGRNYAVPVTLQQHRDMTFIITTLADKPLHKIMAQKSAMDRAGDRIDRVHPLRFLERIFTDEVLKVGLRNIRQRGWAWKEFFAGLSDSLREEARNDNMSDEFIVDFANSVGISVDLIEGSIASQQWEAFVDILIKQIPRSGDPTRYEY